MLSVTHAECHYAECHFAKCRYAECRCAECHYAECRCAECHYAECRGAHKMPFSFILFIINHAEWPKLVSHFSKTLTFALQQQ